MRNVPLKFLETSVTFLFKKGDIPVLEAAPSAGLHTQKYTV